MDKALVPLRWESNLSQSRQAAGCIIDSKVSQYVFPRLGPREHNCKGSFMGAIGSRTARNLAVVLLFFHPE